MKLLIAGDYCPRNRAGCLIENGDFFSVFSEIRPLICNYEYSIVNFECSIVEGDAKPIEKSGPNFCCSVRGADALKWLGFDCVTLANNHFLDYGESGVKQTLDYCKTIELDTVGGGINLEEASKILYKEIEGKTLAVINCCEHEFSIATGKTAGSNPLNPINQYYAIQEAKSKADYVLVIVHGGHEHYQLPSPRMQETYRFFVDAGADAVVNHHQHCYSGYEDYKGKPIFYGIGNFCFDEPSSPHLNWNEGYFVELEFIGEKIQFGIIPYCQCKHEAKVVLLPMDSFNEEIESINRVICNSSILESKINEYYKDNAFLTGWQFEPYRNGVIFRLRQKGLLPSMLKNDERLLITNNLMCESLNEKVRWWLIQELNK